MLTRMPDQAGRMSALIDYGQEPILQAEHDKSVELLLLFYSCASI